jgi:hypothetical protein
VISYCWDGSRRTFSLRSKPRRPHGAFVLVAQRSPSTDKENKRGSRPPSIWGGEHATAYLMCGCHTQARPTARNEAVPASRLPAFARAHSFAIDSAPARATGQCPSPSSRRPRTRGGTPASPRGLIMRSDLPRHRQRRRPVVEVTRCIHASASSDGMNATMSMPGSGSLLLSLIEGTFTSPPVCRGSICSFVGGAPVRLYRSEGFE